VAPLDLSPSRPYVQSGIETRGRVANVVTGRRGSALTGNISSGCTWAVCARSGHAPDAAARAEHSVVFVLTGDSRRARLQQRQMADRLERALLDPLTVRSV
jgi:hypothetical protein